MNFFQTYTGLKFDFENPAENDADICIEDIAHSLSQICRFNGHTKRLYSVAEHCVRMSESTLPGPRIWRLFHDAAEAYIGDMSSPLKQFASLHEIDWFLDLEVDIMKRITRRFQLPPVSTTDVFDLRNADLIMRATEKRDLLVPSDWGEVLPSPLPEKIEPWSADFSEHRFLEMASHFLVY